MERSFEISVEIRPIALWMTTFSIKQPLPAIRGVTEDDRFESIAAVRFESLEWPILVKAAFRPLSGLAVPVRSGLSRYS